MSDDRAELLDTLVANNDPCTGYFLSFNYDNPDGSPAHFALVIGGITIDDDDIVIHTVHPYEGEPVRHRFSGEITVLEDPQKDQGGLWFKLSGSDYGNYGLWLCISSERRTMLPVTAS